MRLKKTLAFGLLMFVFSCRDEAERASMEYCECLIKNDVNKKPLIAYSFCESQLIVKYPLYKYSKIDARYEGYYPLNDSISKKAKEFDLKFTEYTTLHCCKEINRCQLLEDTFYIENSKILWEYKHK